ncbi:MAG: protein kinase [Planctomycetota bacterium]
MADRRVEELPTLGPYRGTRVIAQSPLGTVYAAKGPEGRTVGLRVLGALARALDEADLRRFHRELEALRALSHPHVIGALDHGISADGVPYVVTPLVEGGSLQERLDREGPLSTPEVLELGLALSDALEHVHRAGLLHRDLRPASVLLDREGRPYLTDFGLSKGEGQVPVAVALARAGHPVGSPGYWPPEQLVGEEVPWDARSEVYALGATLYAALTGHPPLEGASLGDVLRVAREQGLVAPSLRRQGVSPLLDAALLRCLASDAAERPPSARALHEELERLKALRQQQRSRSGEDLLASSQRARADDLLGSSRRARAAEDPLAGSSSRRQRAHDEGLAASARLSVLGRRLGPYVLRKQIAQGGMGTVFDAYHERLEREVALKTLRPGQESSDEDLQRFLNEARAAARLNHPNVVPVFDVGEDKGTRYLAMELVRGRSLHDRIRAEGPLSAADALAIIAEAGQGLQHAHDLGILHRDLKPANILLQAPDGTPRITDFGVARAPGNKRLTATGIALGTPNYMSPEQAMGQNDQLDARSDVWGLGAILYECLTGVPPFNLPSQLETMQAVVSEPLVPPSALRPVDEDVEAIVLRCLHKQREERYPSAQDLVDDARRYLAGQPVLARPRTGRERLGDFVRAHALASVVLSLCGVAALLLSFVGGLLLGVRRGGNGGPEGGGGSDGFGAAATACEAALEQARATLGGSPDPAALRALRAGLQPAALRERAQAAAPEADARALDAAAARVARDPAVPALLAEVAWRLGAGATDAAALAEYAEASRLDPSGPSGRAATLALARALEAKADPVAQRLGDQAYAELVGEDAPGAAAALGQAEVEAALLRFASAAALAKRAQQTGLPEAEAERARLFVSLGEAFGGVRSLTPGLVTAANTDIGRSLVRIGESTFDVLPLTGQGQRSLPLTVRTARVEVGDHDGDGVDEMLLVTAERPQAFYLLPLRFDSARNARRSGKSESWICATAVGDLDGDGRADFVLVSDDARASQALLSSAAGDVEQGVPLLPRDGALARLSCAAAVDLDGDGKGELLLGGAEGDDRLRALRYADGAFAGLGELRLGAAAGVRAVPLEGRREGALVAIDARRGEGHDGVALVGLRGEQLALLGRWDYPGPATGQEDVVAALLDLGQGGRWVARAATTPFDWALELCPLEALAAGRPRLALRIARSRAPGGGDGRLELLQLDDDAYPELILGGFLLGLGQAAAEAGPQPLAPPSAGVPRDLLAWRRLQALELGEAAAATEARLRAEHGDAGAQALAVAGLEDELLRVEQERVVAWRRHRLGDPQGGEASWSAQAERARRTLTAARALSEQRLPGELRATAQVLRGYAALAADEPTEAREALEAALRSRDLDHRSRIAAADAQALARALAALQRRSADFRSAELQGLVGVTDALESRLDQAGVTLGVDPRVDRAALVNLQSIPPLSGALEVDAQLSVQGLAMRSAARVGVFRAEGASIGKHTGFAIKLFRAGGGPRRPELEVVVEGEPLGEAIDLPFVSGELGVRLALTEQAGRVIGDVAVRDAQGAVRMRYRVFGPAGRTLPARAERAGLVAYKHPQVWQEERDWPRRAEVTLHSLTLGLPQACEWRGISDPYAAFAVLARGDVGARAALDRALNAERQRPAAQRSTAFAVQIMFARAMARARTGDAEGALDDLRQLARSTPLQLAWELELHAETIEEGPRERALVLARLLDELARDEDPALQVLSRQLRGDLSAYEAPTKAGNRSNSRLLLEYLSFRRAGVSYQERWTHYTGYQASLPNSQLPWRSFPDLLAVETAPLADADWERLARKAEGAPPLLERYRDAHRALAARPQRPEPYLRLAELAREERLYGVEEDYLRRALARGGGPQALVALGRCYLDLGCPDEAYRALEEAVRGGLDPKALPAQFPDLAAEPRLRALVGG